MRLLLIACMLVLAACSRTQETRAPAPAKATADTRAIEWMRPTSLADIDAAFERAKGKGQPVFLFWTATWCPPCNHVKSTVFTREDFIAKSRSFIPVYVDGDTPGGQAIGKRFHVSGYPTMVLLTPERREVTRLAGSVDATRYLQLLDLGLASSNSAAQILSAVQAGQPISGAEWRILAYHSWATDEDQLVPEHEAPATLMKLATSCPPAERESASRLVLQALAAAASAKPESKLAIDKADARASVSSLLAQPELVREHYDLFAGAADDIVGLVSEAKSPERRELVTAWTAALDRLLSDRTLSKAARVWITSGKVNLARLDNTGPLSTALLDQVRTEAARADRETTDRDERQSVITSAGGMLSRAGLHDEADALLRAELSRSHSPYYYMLGLALNERRRGTQAGKAAAIDWARQAYETSTGPATRIEWGASYLRYLIELAPDDSARIKDVALMIVGDLPPQPGAYSGRSQHTLERTSVRLLEWSKGRHDQLLAEVNSRIVPVCARAAAEPADRAACETLFTPTRRS